MKKLLGIVVLGFFINTSAKSIDKTIAIFDFYKPLPEINMSIGSPITTSYDTLKKNLTLVCSV